MFPLTLNSAIKGRKYTPVYFLEHGRRPMTPNSLVPTYPSNPFIVVGLELVSNDYSHYYVTKVRIVCISKQRQWWVFRIRAVEHSINLWGPTILTQTLFFKKISYSSNN